MKSLTVLTLINLALLTLSHNSWALRCDGKIISEGDYMFEVEARCGEPAFKNTKRKFVTTERRQEITSPSKFDDKAFAVENERSRSVTEEILIEEWVYNMGKNKLTQMIEFIDGKVVAIETGGYGE